MKYSMTLVVFLSFTILPLAAQTPAEKVGKRLDELLQPRTKPLKTDDRSPSAAWRAPRSLEQPELPIAVYQGTPPQMDAARRRVRPWSMSEGMPLAHYREQPTVPKPIELPTEPLVRVLSVDTNVPLELPILAQPQKDRASLADPTLEASVAAALKPLTPERTQPVPFSAINLPDPFENVQAGRLRNPPEENSQPPAIPVQTPRR